MMDVNFSKRFLRKLEKRAPHAAHCRAVNVIRSNACRLRKVLDLVF